MSPAKNKTAIMPHMLSIMAIVIVLALMIGAIIAAIKIKE